MKNTIDHQPRFLLGQLLATPGAIALLDDANVDALTLLRRHVFGDWGVVPREDALANDEALLTGARVLSSYDVGVDKIWIITEADRRVTTLLLPSEY